MPEAGGRDVPGTKADSENEGGQGSFVWLPDIMQA
jgi:hypothetical protein